MSKKNEIGLQKFGPPPQAPPSYAQAVGGVPPTSPFVPNHSFRNGVDIVTTVVPVGPEQTHMICPHCHAEIDTTTKTKPGILAYLAAISICIICCPISWCLIPCCIHKCMDVHHHCPNCKSFLGKYQR